MFARYEQLAFTHLLQWIEDQPIYPPAISKRKRLIWQYQLQINAAINDVQFQRFNTCGHLISPSLLPLDFFQPGLKKTSYLKDAIPQIAKKQNFPRKEWLMAETLHIPYHLLTFVLFHLALFASSSYSVSFGFYATSCPTAEIIVKNTVREASSLDPTLPGKLLRLVFHDCFVEVSLLSSHV